jgi:hypothetical protein
LGHNLGVRRFGEGGRVPLPLLAVSGVALLAAGLGFAVASAPDTRTRGVAVGAHVHSNVVRDAGTTGAGSATGASNGAAFGGDGHTDHSHLGPTLEVQITDPATRRKLNRQLAAARDAVRGVHTAADAMAQGYVQVTVDLAYLGVHYLKTEYLSQPFDPSRPTHLIFGTDAPDAPLIGLMYYVNRVGRPPSGFAGPNDLWHRHLQACMNEGIMLALDDISVEQCAGIGGVITPLGAEYESRWMVHVWAVPGQENPWGTFANGDPVLA